MTIKELRGRYNALLRFFRIGQAEGVMMKLPSKKCSICILWPLFAVTAAANWFGGSTQAFGQANGCVLISDDRNPLDKILRCGEGLSIRSTPNARYHLTDQDGSQTPAAARLDSGALMIEFTPGKHRRNFQILTPQAIAAVRGTKWVVEVISGRTSTLVLSGTVEVARRRGARGAVLQAGEGIDVSAGSGPLVVKRWAKRRVDALLARFNQ